VSFMKTNNNDSYLFLVCCCSRLNSHFTTLRLAGGMGKEVKNDGRILWKRAFTRV
jgi:hypothetical protein